MASKASHIASSTSYAATATGTGYKDPRSKLDAARVYAELAGVDTPNQSAHVAVSEVLLAEIENKSTVSLPPSDFAYVHSLLARVTT